MCICLTSIAHHVPSSKPILVADHWQPLGNLLGTLSRKVASFTSTSWRIKCPSELPLRLVLVCEVFSIDSFPCIDCASKVVIFGLDVFACFLQFGQGYNFEREYIATQGKCMMLFPSPMYDKTLLSLVSLLCQS